MCTYFVSLGPNMKWSLLLLRQNLKWQNVSKCEFFSPSDMDFIPAIFNKHCKRKFKWQRFFHNVCQNYFTFANGIFYHFKFCHNRRNGLCTCNGGVDLATIMGLGPGSLNMVSTSWSPISSSMSIAPGGQLFGEWAGEVWPCPPRPRPGRPWPPEAMGP